MNISIKPREATSTVADLLSVQKVEPAKATLVPKVAEAEVILGVNQRVPSSWKVLPTEDGIEATCGGHMFAGSTADFSAMLRAGKYSK
jgi:hypothetical protein